LFEFARSENKLTRGNFVSERLSNLRDSEWQTLARGVDNVFKVYVDSLTGFSSKVDRILVHVPRKVSEVRSYEQIKFLRDTKIALSTFWTGELLAVLVNENINRFLGHLLIRRYPNVLKEVIDA
jgi:hypothetical protein